jgi:hypothetical protein
LTVKRLQILFGTRIYGIQREKHSDNDEPTQPPVTVIFLDEPSKSKVPYQPAAKGSLRSLAQSPPDGKPFMSSKVHSGSSTSKAQAPPEFDPEHFKLPRNYQKIVYP